MYNSWVDISRIESNKAGDEAILLGNDISAENLADVSGSH